MIFSLQDKMSGMLGCFPFLAIKRLFISGTQTNISLNLVGYGLK